MVKWWVDASYAVHEDCKGHTGAMTSLEKGVVLILSAGKKINRKISTEGEMIGVDNGMANIIW